MKIKRKPRQVLSPKEGDLRVWWWVPQVPTKSFTVPVDSIEMGVWIMDILAQYDLFQYENRIKPDYSNAGGIQQWSLDTDGEGTPGWEEWADPETGEDDPRKYLEDKKKTK